jgi:hypothetical protein
MPWDIIRSDRFRRFQSFNGLVDIRIRNRCKRQEFSRLRKRGKVYRTIIIIIIIIIIIMATEKTNLSHPILFSCLRFAW